MVLIDTWLTEEQGPEEPVARVAAHVGYTAVGTLSADAAREFAPDLAAAKFYDELVRISGRLTQTLSSTESATSSLSVSRQSPNRLLAR